jgi:hypothetical protein
MKLQFKSMETGIDYLQLNRTKLVLGFLFEFLFCFCFWFGLFFSFLWVYFCTFSTMDSLPLGSEWIQLQLFDPSSISSSSSSSSSSDSEEENRKSISSSSSSFCWANSSPSSSSLSTDCFSLTSKRGSSTVVVDFLRCSSSASFIILIFSYSFI